MNNREWLQNLKVGDKVIEDLHYGNNKHVAIVVRLTKTLIIVETKGTLKNYESRYRIEDGYAPGRDAYTFSCIREATPEALAKLEEEQYRNVFQNKLNHLSWAAVPLDRIKEVREIIEPYIRKQDK